jgi:hypothetical protein
VRFRSPAPVLHLRPPSPAQAAPQPDARASAQQKAAPSSFSLSAPRRPQSRSNNTHDRGLLMAKSLNPLAGYALQHHTIAASDSPFYDTPSNHPFLWSKHVTFRTSRSLDAAPRTSRRVERRLPTASSPWYSAGYIEGKADGAVDAPGTRVRVSFWHPSA